MPRHNGGGAMRRRLWALPRSYGAAIRRRAGIYTSLARRHRHLGAIATGPMAPGVARHDRPGLPSPAGLVQASRQWWPLGKTMLRAYLLSAGYTPVPNWPSCFWHPEPRLFLVVYVNDFKMAGPVSNMEKRWSRIRSGIRTEESKRVLPDSGVCVRVMEYNMESLLLSCVSRYS